MNASEAKKLSSSRTFGQYYSEKVLHGVEFAARRGNTEYYHETFGPEAITNEVRQEVKDRLVSEGYQVDASGSGILVRW